MEQFRSIQQFWVEDDWLKQRMLFLSGPRQAGKTTIVRTNLCQREENIFNWDDRKVRALYRSDPHFFSNAPGEWICFDEIHKRNQWKNILKGIYDTFKTRFRFVVTGSARLEVFRRSGDSLVGRYFNTHLFPLNLGDFARSDFRDWENAETLLKTAGDTPDESRLLDSLLNLGGFPEPFFSGSEKFWKRWSKQHEELIVREDLRDLSRISDLDKIEHLLNWMKPAVGNTISNSNIAQDIETTHGSIKRWLNELHKVQLLFPVPPYTKNIRRAYRQELKWYFVDWKAAEKNVFENYVAASLYRTTILFQDRFGEDLSLFFLRTHDQTEIDFLVTRNNRPWLLVESKTGTVEASATAFRYAHLLNCPCAIVTSKPGVFRKIVGKEKQNVFLVSWSKVGALLP